MVTLGINHHRWGLSICPSTTLSLSVLGVLISTCPVLLKGSYIASFLRFSTCRAETCKWDMLPGTASKCGKETDFKLSAKTFGLGDLQKTTPLLPGNGFYARRHVGERRKGILVLLSLLTTDKALSGQERSLEITTPSCTVILHQ